MDRTSAENGQASRQASASSKHAKSQTAALVMNIRKRLIISLKRGVDDGQFHLNYPPLCCYFAR